MHETVDIQVLEWGETRILCGGDIQHIALVRAPTDAQGSEGIKPVLIDQMDAVMDGARRAFSVRLTKNTELPRDTLDEGLVDLLKTLYEFESSWTTSTVE